MRKRVVPFAVAFLAASTFGSAAGEVTVKGEIVEVSCYSKLGVVKGTGASHVACAKQCAAKGLGLGVLTDGDGLFKLTGTYTENNNAKLMDYLGKQVSIIGTKDRANDYSAAINVTKISVTK